MTCPNCARLTKRYSLLMKEMAMRHGNEMAMLQKVYATKPDKKTATLAVLERDKLKNENKKLSEKAHNNSRQLREIKKTLKQREAYVQVLLRLLEKNGLKKEIDKHIRAYNALNKEYKHQIERYEDMDSRWRRYCEQLTTENKTIKKRLEGLKVDNELLLHAVQRYKTKERNFMSENKEFKAKDVSKMDDAEKNREDGRSSELSSLSLKERSLSGTSDLFDALINQIDDKKTNPFIRNNNQLDETSIVNHNDIQDINNNDNELNNVSDSISERSDIYKDGCRPRS